MDEEEEYDEWYCGPSKKELKEQADARRAKMLAEQSPPPRSQRKSHKKTPRRILIPVIDRERCVICGDRFDGPGHNPEPLKQKGRCCNTCNLAVINARWKML
jgi:hypothetical protein